MIPYDTSFSPAAPVLRVTFQNTKGTAYKITAPMQIDTGADLTVIPESVMADLGLVAEGETPVEDYEGVARTHPFFFVHLQIDRWTIKNVRVIAHSGQMGVLGRNVLHGFTVTLRGKEQTFDIVDP